MFFTQKLSFKFRPGLTKERVELHDIAHYRSNVGLMVNRFDGQYQSFLAIDDRQTE